MIRTLVLFLSVITATSAYEEQTIDAKVLPHSESDSQCPSAEETERVLNEIHRITYQAIANMSGANLYTCNGTPGWRRVAFINMTDTSYNCPTGLRLIEHPKRTCASPLHSGGQCSSITFSVGGLPYSQVCGRMRGYQFGVTDAFHGYIHQDYRQGIDGYYIDGVSLTHGGAGRRQHIWTFAAGLLEILPRPEFVLNTCPCDSGNYNVVPAFIGNDYFCESGVNLNTDVQFQFYPDDVLWDGQDCTSTSTCCQLNNPPWFTKNLPAETIDDIELRICTSAITSAEDTPLELIELYIQ